MKRIVLLLSLLCALTAAGPAAAERGDRSRGNDQPQRDQRQDRDAGRQDRRDSNSGGGYDREQLSREQREQLRRDISDHGREIYRDRRERR